MAKKLNLLPDEEIFLIGVITREKDYRLVFEVNRKLGMTFKKDEDLLIMPLKQKEHSSFSCFADKEDEDGRRMFILANRGTAGLLVPEQKQLDYFILMKGSYFEDERKELLRSLKTIPVVQGAYEIETTKLKSRQNLIF